MCDVCPDVFLRINQTGEVGGATLNAYRISDMYIELDLPHNYVFNTKNKDIITCLLIHEYCHYLDALSMSSKKRAQTAAKYLDSLQERRLQEQRNWTATKRLSKRLGLWNKAFYMAVRTHRYTAMLRF